MFFSCHFEGWLSSSAGLAWALMWPRLGGGLSGVWGPLGWLVVQLGHSLTVIFHLQ